MEKLRDKLFIALATLMASACIIHGAIAALLPDYEISRVSLLEARTLFSMPSLTSEGVLSGEFQRAAEKAVADAVPLRDEILLANAALQRVGIVSANSLFGFGSYHTFYDSRYIAIPEHAAYVRELKKQSASFADGLRSAAQCINALVDASPQIDWACVFPDNSMSSVSNPAYELMTSPADNPYCFGVFLSELDSRCSFIDVSVESAEEYFDFYFRTDHHWKIQGAYDAYKKVAEALGIDVVPAGELFTAYEGPFYGSQARLARAQDYYDEVPDIMLDTSSFEVRIEDETFSEADGLGGYRGEGQAALELEGPFDSAYAAYYHHDYAFIEITNNECEDGTLLIIGDSYTNCIERFFAASYRTVYVIDPRYYEGSVRDFIATHDIDDAVVMVCISVVSQFPSLESMNK